MNATAYMGYSYRDDKWCLMGLNLIDDALPPASQISKALTDKGNYLWPVFVDAPIKSLKWGDGRYRAVICEDYDFPEVLTLEQSIENNRKLLSTY